MLVFSELQIELNAQPLVAVFQVQSGQLLDFIDAIQERVSVNVQAVCGRYRIIHIEKKTVQSFQKFRAGLLIIGFQNGYLKILSRAVKALDCRSSGCQANGRARHFDVEKAPGAIL